MNKFPVCSIDHKSFHGWKAVTLKNGIVSLVIVPDIGGRIMAYNLGDYPYLFVDPDLAGKLFSYEENLGDGTMAAWKNYGGDKTWPAPQGWDNDNQWHGPPDPILDSGRYKIQNVKCTDQEAIVRMISLPDPRTGIQITRQITLLQGGSRVILDLSFKNMSKRRIRWSIWNVTQLRAEKINPDGSISAETNCIVTVPINPHSRFPQGFYVMAGDENNPQWGVDHEKQLFIGQYMWEIGKVGINSLKGWIAFSNSAQGYAFAEQFTYFAEREYPDRGATVECWTTGRGTVSNLNYEENPIYLIETEVLSPLYTFKPGETRSFQISWGACRCEGQVIDVTKAGCVHQPLAVKSTGYGLELGGSFGVFDCGILQLAWEDGEGKPLKVDILEEVDPLDFVNLNRIIQPPPQAERIELQLNTHKNNFLYTLAKCQI